MTRARLRNKYETNRDLRDVSVWLILKHLTTSGKIKDWRGDQLQNLLMICKRRPGSFWQCLKRLQQLGFVTLEGGDIILCSWQDLYEFYGVDQSSHTYTFQYDYTSNEKIEYRIISADIEINQGRQGFKVLRKLDKNPVHKAILITEIIKRGADRFRLKEPEYLRAQLKMLYMDDFQSVSDIHDVIILYRPFTDRGIKGMAAAWNRKSPSTATYAIRQMIKQKIIDRSKLQIQSQDRVRNPFCDIKWVKATKQTLQAFCGMITVLHPHRLHQL